MVERHDGLAELGREDGCARLLDHLQFGSECLQRRRTSMRSAIIRTDGFTHIYLPLAEECGLG